MKEPIKFELSLFLSPLFLSAAYDSWSSKEQRGEWERLGLERDMVIFAPRFLWCCTLWMSHQVSRLYGRSGKVIQQNFSGRKGCKFSQGEVRAEDQLSFQGRPACLGVWHMRPWCVRGWTLHSKTVSSHWAEKIWREAEKSNDFFSQVFCVIHDVKTLFHLFTVVNIFIILLDPTVRLEFPWLWYYTASRLGEEGFTTHHQGS